MNENIHQLSDSGLTVCKELSGLMKLVESKKDEILKE